MKKLIFIAPHLSTGGLPQYLLKKIQTLINDYEISLIEYSDVTGGVLVVQRNQLKQIIPQERFYTLGNDKKEIINIINKIDPDIVHLEEMPEYFMDYEVSEKIYASNRRYKIFETSHDSSFKTDNKIFFPDKFLLVSNYQVEMLKNLNIPSAVVEYPIEYKNRIPKDEALRKLDLDPSYKHVINVGLFTPRKNQKEVFEYAKNLKDYKIKFHFIGNQADNFKFYWESLLNDAPDNCIIWGERTDVETFYSIADLFLFTSRGFSSDKETSPLVIKEAIGYRIPSLIYNLPVYQGMYDKYSNINYLSTDENNEDKILNILGLHKINESDFAKIDTTDDLKEKVIQKIIKIRNEKNKDSDFFIDVDFEEDNKIVFRLKKDTDQNYEVSIKDIDSKACIYSLKIPIANSGYTSWAIPLPKHIIDFKNNQNFGGFLVQFFTSEGELIKSIEKRYREIPFKKPVMDITNSEPIFMNYEEFFTDKIYDSLDIKNPKIVFDIGASLGLWSKYILYKGAKKVYCFEPNKKAIVHLKKSLENDNVEIVEKAIYKEMGDLEFYVDQSNSITSSLYSIDGHSSTYKVNAITLEDAINLSNENRIDLVKIDTEGAEFDIIKNTPDHVFDRIDSFIIEYHDFLFLEGEAKLFSLEQRLKKLGYNIIRPNVPNTKYIFATKNPDVKIQKQIEDESKIPFRIRYTGTDNKIEVIPIEYSDRSFIISCKDIDSKACIYSFRMDPPYNKDIIYWFIPIPQNCVDFNKDPNFGGICVQFFDVDENLLHEENIRIKEIRFEKPVMDVSNTEPVWINYNEFYVDKIYDVIDLSKYKSIIDIGANVGLWTNYILSKGAEKVYSFEPNKKALDHLTKYFKDDSRVEIFDKAIYKEKSVLKFFAGDNSILSSIFDRYSSNKNTYDVESITLEDAIKLTGRDSIDLVKIDIEGAELDIIKYISDVSVSMVNSFLIECHDHFFNSKEEYDSNLIEEILKSKGYTCSRPGIKGSKFILAEKKN
jgi:FkbM family methyltransferase